MYYYKHHIGDFRSGTSNMSRQERWLYRDMLDVYYDKESPLPLDLQDVCDSIGATDEESKSVAKILRLKFNLGETGWVHERCEVELDTYRANAEKARYNGKKGGRPRKNNPAGSLPVASGMQDGTGCQPDGNPQESGSQANHKPVTINQEPVTSNHEPIAEKQEHLKSNPVAPAVAVAAEKKPRKEAKAAPGTGKVWVAYATAYWNRYGVEPVRNAMVNGQLSSLVKRIGFDDAEHVAAFFVGHQHRYYVEKMHSVGLLLADCEKLRTEWATSTQMTQAKASQADKTATNLDAFAPLIAAAKAREEAERNRNGQ